MDDVLRVRHSAGAVIRVAQAFLPVLVCASIVALSQPAGNSIGWIAGGQGGSIRETPAANAAEFTYPLGTKQFAVAMLPTHGTLARMRRLRFRIKTDHDTAIAVLLSEKKPGGDYTTIFWAPAGVWQTIELTPADFSLNNGPNDPVDADGKLDLDQVQGVAILDFAHFLGSMPENPAFPVIVSRPSGTHTLTLAGFEVLETAAPLHAAVKDEIHIDSFDRGFLEWMTLGGMKLKLSPRDNPLHAPALEAEYEQIEGQYSVLVRRLSNLDLSAANRLAFDIASERDVTLVLSLDSGARYNLTIFPPASRKVFHVNLDLASFERDQNAPASGPAHVDPSRLKSLTITDVSAAAGGDVGTNTIWIGNLTALK